MAIGCGGGSCGDWLRWWWLWPLVAVLVRLVVAVGRGVGLGGERVIESSDRGDD